MTTLPLLSLVLALVIAGLVFWLVIWLVDYIGVPEPFNKVIKVVVAVAAVLYLIGVITGNAPHIRL